MTEPADMSEAESGRARSGDAVHEREIVLFVGSPLRTLADSFRLMQDTRKVLQQRGAPDDAIDGALKLEKMLDRALQKEFKRSFIAYDWLPVGMRGALMARLVAMIGDPRRFPGQRCSQGHLLASIYEVGVRCPVVESPHADDDSDGPGTDAESLLESEPLNGRVPGPVDATSESDKTSGCPGTLLAPRRGSGVRSLWHYAGLIERDGKLIRKTKGQRCDFSPRMKSLILMPDVGLRSQINRHQPEPYYTLKCEQKERLLALGKPRWQAEKTSGTIAIKRLLGDLLMEWKRRLAE